MSSARTAVSNAVAVLRSGATGNRIRAFDASTVTAIHPQEILA